MLLKRLQEYSHRLEDLPQAGYDKTAIRYLINLDAEGNFLGFISTTSGKKRDRGKEYFAPAVLKSSNIKASLLVGNAEYVLGVARDLAKQGRVDHCHQAFVAEVKKCALATQISQIQAVLQFLESPLQLKILLPDDFDPTMNLTFQVENMLPIELSKVQDYWAGLQGQDFHGDPAKPSQCLVCGKGCVPTERHPIKLKGIPGGQPSGMALVSANAPAFESYGLEASQIAPVCLDCAERYAKAYNVLREQEDTHLIVGSLVYLFWTRKEVGFNIASLFSRPEPAQVRELIQSAPRGRLYSSLNTEAFYATALSASGGRVVVRDWLETTVGEAKQHLARWFFLQDLVDGEGGVGRPYGLYALGASLLSSKNPDLRRDLSPNIPRILLKVALQGGPLPHWLLFQTLQRNRAEQAITRTRAVLIKMVLLSNQENPEENAMVRLDEANLNPAYLCGRLMALLEQVQFQAVSPKATLIDRFYGTASTAPGTVFPRLIKGAQAHLGKLRKEKPGVYAALQNKLMEVLGNLSGFPRVLTLEEQGWFSLGYYHQKAWDREQARARRQGAEVPVTDDLTPLENEE
jgi:CRISPR-associated protein Csd1